MVKNGYKKGHMDFVPNKFEKKIFNNYGWDLIFFNEIEVNEEGVLNKLK